VGVVLGVGAGYQHQVERQPDLEAADLDVPLLQDVEQGDLDTLRQVGKLVDRQDPAVGAGDETVVDGQLVGEVAALGHPDGVDVTDEVGHRGVGRRQLLREALVGGHPDDGGRVAHLGHQGPAGGADGVVGVVVDLAARHDGDLVVQKVDEGADQPGLGLAPLAEENDVVAGEDAPLQRRQNRVREPHDGSEHRLLGPEAAGEVGAELLLDGAVGVAGGSKFGEGGGQSHL
jgi:hypothetical protein